MALAMEWPPAADGLAVGFGVRGIGRRALFFASVHSWVSSELELGSVSVSVTVSCERDRRARPTATQDRAFRYHEMGTHLGDADPDPRPEGDVL